jgi:hypothetical protein
MGEQQHQAGNNGQYRITEQVDGMSHFLAITLDHRLQFFDIFRGTLALDKAIYAIGYCQDSENEIKAGTHSAVIVTQLKGEQYREERD